MDYQGLRVEYQSAGLTLADVAENPFDEFRSWLAEAVGHEAEEPNTMMLATANSSARPSVRAVLLKDFSDQGLLFFTNYESEKGRDIAVNPQASVSLLWQPLHRQVRISGSIRKANSDVSDTYFDIRPEPARRGAVASPQSRVIPEDWLDDQAGAVADLRRPTNWGGYLLEPDMFEFWQGQPSRLHDRLRYRLADGVWSIDRLAP
jgi:pyridoxamine 5'-phosphate oxidase